VEVPLFSFSLWLAAMQANLSTNLPDSLVGMAVVSDVVVQGVLLLLISASIVSWTIIFAKTYQFWTAGKASQQFSDLLWESNDLASIYSASLSLRTSPTAVVFHTGYQALQQETQQVKKTGSTVASASSPQLSLSHLEQAVRRAQQEQEARLERRLLHLATISSAAPFVGLFGTVWGIMNAFRGLSTAQASSIQAVAPGIAEALIATAVGLAAAIPAVVAYNYFTARVQGFTEAIETVIARFLLLAQRALSV